MRARIFGPSTAGSIPRMRSVPPLTGETAAAIRIVEDLPAPLGPRKPKASPRRTTTSMPRTASTVSPERAVNDLVNPDASIIASLTVTDPSRDHVEDSPPYLRDCPVRACRCREGGCRGGAVDRLLLRLHPDLVRGGLRRAPARAGRRLGGDRRRSARAGGGTDRVRQDARSLPVVH